MCPELCRGRTSNSKCATRLPLARHRQRHGLLPESCGSLFRLNVITYGARFIAASHAAQMGSGADLPIDRVDVYAVRPAFSAWILARDHDRDVALRLRRILVQNRLRTPHREDHRCPLRRGRVVAHRDHSTATFGSAPQSVVTLMVAGGLAYSVGVMLLVFDRRLPYLHTAWHVFVLAGSALHYWAISIGLNSAKFHKANQRQICRPSTNWQRTGPDQVSHLLASKIATISSIRASAR